LNPYCVPWLIENIAPGPGEILINRADANNPSQTVSSIIYYLKNQIFSA
jgi:hypothetical protein